MITASLYPYGTCVAYHTYDIKKAVLGLASNLCVLSGVFVSRFFVCVCVGDYLFVLLYCY